MNENRERLKAIARGQHYTPFPGMPVALWLCIERGEYNAEAYARCKAIVAHHQQQTGRKDRQSVFFNYLNMFEK